MVEEIGKKILNIKRKKTADDNNKKEEKPLPLATLRERK